MSIYEKIFQRGCLNGLSCRDSRVDADDHGARGSVPRALRLLSMAFRRAPLSPGGQPALHSTSGTHVQLPRLHVAVLARPLREGGIDRSWLMSQYMQTVCEPRVLNCIYY